MTAFESTMLRPVSILHEPCLRALLIVFCGACGTANAALLPPAGYFAAVRIKPGQAGQAHRQAADEGKAGAA